MSEHVMAHAEWTRPIIIFGVPGVLLGFFLANLIPRSSSNEQPAPYVLEQLDYNQDGTSDVQVFYSNGYQSLIRYDRNFDNHPDYEVWFSRGMPVRNEADNDFDGRADYWGDYRNGYLVSARSDTDFNGVADNVEIFRNGNLVRVEWYPNGQTNLLCAELFEHGVKRKEIRSAGGANAAERTIAFDPFGAVLQNDADKK